MKKKNILLTMYELNFKYYLNVLQASVCGLDYSEDTRRQYLNLS
jgi:hypothetical protein